MCWKKIKYWLKGGLIGLIIALVYDLRILYIGEARDLGTWIFGLITDLIVIFIIGALIGLLIGFIIKKRKIKKPVRKIVKRKVRKKK